MTAAGDTTTLRVALTFTRLASRRPQISRRGSKGRGDQGVDRQTVSGQGGQGGPGDAV